MNPSRRQFLAAAAAVSRVRAASAKPRLALIASDFPKLAQPASAEHPLDYARVRDMVWRAIELGRPAAGSLEAKIRPGSWVVVKPNIGHVPGQSVWRPGDTTDLRVVRAVVEYVARKSRAGRITVAEGGTYRGPNDPAADNHILRDGHPIHMTDLDWGEEFPGFAGSINNMLGEFRREFQGRKFDYVDLSYDAFRDARGGFARTESPRSANGAGAFGARADYFTSKTIRECEFLINVPVMKVHLTCGITACLKNYVGTAPREAYAPPGSFSNGLLHSQHSVEGRLDPFIVDLAAFHPPDYNIVDCLRGLQYQEHFAGRPDQMLRGNFVIAGEDTVAADALVADVMGFNRRDMEYLHLAAQRGIGDMDPRAMDVAGSDPEKVRRRWGKPRNWFGRANREWRITRDPGVPVAEWTRYRAPTDTVSLTRVLGPAPVYAASVRVRAMGASKGFLWAGVRGRFTATLNGETVMREENFTRYRIGQFQKPVELRSGENLLGFRVEPAQDGAQLSALLVGPRNDGDTMDGIEWIAD